MDDKTYGKRLEQAHQAYLINKSLRNYDDEKQVYVTGYMDALEQYAPIMEQLQEVFKQWDGLGEYKDDDFGEVQHAMGILREKMELIK